MRSFWLSLVALPLLAACVDQPRAPVPTAGPVTQAKIPPQDFAPGLVDESSEDGKKKLFNDPSAPLDTPLCGSALQEQARAGAAVYAQSLASTSSCPRNACFQPLTGTYIAATGAQSVCR
ncbi:hypothetical protein [Gluconobacter kanchanaburiensis]|uniref:Lipoprotein n=1 Tax=Gluconobacter kanchanaburiensis NBRC 103587 TaxID=1307948 RepID=A0A511B3C3_9PROT|nr:hypothetical protein [Gluconobacter kanchanaburiensis]MBF0860889.1 hypothetical protein [Gluconobacter kanchanaburiensis]GBR69991.1 hypothetical protein AA103587_1626 [Gluconobacter kanchanaburiensis NBRC 103587]GEK94934.1 hypothetical protein GKA01_01310 [Gluconobacter kanchanaburiensis NBRC 103587]